MFENIAVLIFIGCLAAISEGYVQRRERNTKIPEDCSACGIRMLSEGYVIGGKNSNPSTYPWLVSLRSSDRDNYCGGAIINDLFILTAGHCVKSSETNELLYNLKVYFQTSSSNKLSKGYDIEKIIIHPEYSLYFPKSSDVILAQNDVALIKLKKKIKCNEYRNSICLPSPKFKLSSNDESIIAGWGKNDKHRDNILIEGRVKHLHFEECIKAISETARIRNHSLCEGDTKQTVCYGDSGSPLVHEIRNKFYKFYVVGVTSSETDTQCKPSSPVIFMNVVNFLDWIHKHIK